MNGHDFGHTSDTCARSSLAEPTKQATQAYEGDLSREELTQAEDFHIVTDTLRDFFSSFTMWANHVIRICFQSCEESICRIKMYMVLLSNCKVFWMN